jgi:hypothetical protein
MDSRFRMRVRLGFTGNDLTADAMFAPKPTSEPSQAELVSAQNHYSYRLSDACLSPADPGIAVDIRKGGTVLRKRGPGNQKLAADASGCGIRSVGSRAGRFTSTPLNFP